jgi:hypothetical protein
MILLILLIVPIMFWLIPLAKLREQEKNIKKRYLINFSMMLFTIIILGFILTFLNTEIRTMVAILFSISAAWAVVYHLISKK